MHVLYTIHFVCDNFLRATTLPKVSKITTPTLSLTATTSQAQSMRLHERSMHACMHVSGNYGRVDTLGQSCNSINYGLCFILSSCPRWNLLDNNLYINSAQDSILYYSLIVHIIIITKHNGTILLNIMRAELHAGEYSYRIPHRRQYEGKPQDKHPLDMHSQWSTTF